jgi:DNA adenine methylase
MKRLPHPIPYQGSKRLLAGRVLSVLGGRHFRRFYEPFAGSAAITLAAANVNLANTYVISDTLEPLIAIWSDIIDDPLGIAERYQQLWNAQHGNNKHYSEVRDHYNSHGGSAELLYLLARCVKNALRFNRAGLFNQSADLRRKGMHPKKMRQAMVAAAALLRNRATVRASDYCDALAEAESCDVVYMDPPYEGTTVGADKRYFQQVERERLLSTLNELNQRRIPFLLSYDGRHGTKTYGEPLPETLKLTRLEIVVGRSSQGTLSGRNVLTVESLYISPALRESATRAGNLTNQSSLFQSSLEFA